MSLPRDFLYAQELDRYGQPPSEREVLFTKDYGTHYLTFATTDWPKAIGRQTVQTGYIEARFSFFASFSILSERDLGDEWHARFDRYAADRAYAMFAWKPRVLLSKLSSIPDGDVLLYLDGGCSFPGIDRLKDFLTEIGAVCDSIHSGEYALASSRFRSPCETNTSRKFLTYFGLLDDLTFRHDFPHWQAGTLVLRNDSWTRELLTEWYGHFYNGYEDFLKRDWANHDGELPMFLHDGCDQSLLQALLYRRNASVLNMTGILSQYNIITHLQEYKQ